ncbi:MAG: sigma D regulator [Natronospirillum sp.]|uniref:sigma D regulator n=1 Tax=Natronospirillum sp. TaxID=2812955 RepID=UPI0025F8DAC9|nr:sigma D regulator [Natronospirillum sp.]MCH8552562.1 sigma D regulator [Natronospirillum sp.]
MLEQCQNARERWGGVHEIIDRWLAERRELIVRMFAINGGRDLLADEAPVEERIQRFCEVLVDYVSAGHFEVYQQLLQEAREFRDTDLDAARVIFGRLEDNTEHVLTFNDTYRDSLETRQNLGELDRDLSRLGERLEERFELEDKLIQDLHEVHRDKILSED